MDLNHSLNLTLGFKNKKRPSGPIELDLEAGNLVNFHDIQEKFSMAINS